MLNPVCWRAGKHDNCWMMLLTFYCLQRCALPVFFASVWQNLPSSIKPAFNQSSGAWNSPEGAIFRVSNKKPPMAEGRTWRMITMQRGWGVQCRFFVYHQVACLISSIRGRNYGMIQSSSDDDMLIIISSLSVAFSHFLPRQCLGNGERKRWQTARWHHCIKA